MEAVLKTKLPNWVQDVYSFTSNLFGTLCLFMLVYRAFWYGGDWVGTALLIAGAFIAALVFVVCSEHPKKRHQNQVMRGLRAGALLIVMLFATKTVGSTPNDLGYWVNMANGQSTVVRYFLFMPLQFYPQPISFVSKQQDQGVGIKVKSLDGIPVHCDVWAKGIVLDQRDLLKLEQSFAEVTPASKPSQDYIRTRVMSVLADTAGAVFTSKTSEEIGRQGQFIIPYKIGTPMGDVLSRLVLRWQNGEVTFNCKVLFNN